MIGQLTRSEHGFDIIDALIDRCGGERLAPPAGADGGEYDYLTEGKVTSGQVRRLSAAGLISPRGRRADVLADLAGWDGDVSSFVEWYVRQGLAGLDQRRERRTGDEWATQERPDDGTWPVLLVEYFDRLVFTAKRTYAEQYAAHLLHGAPLPVDPGSEWAHKARAKVDRLVRLLAKVEGAR